jgi:hypothetical protein
MTMDFVGLMWLLAWTWGLIYLVNVFVGSLLDLFFDK